MQTNYIIPGTSSDIIERSWYYPMFCVSLLISARPSEVCGLKDNCLKINPTAISFECGYNRHGAVTNMKTAGSHREIPIPDILYHILKKRLLWKKQMQLAYPGFTDNDFLFTTDSGFPIRPDQFSKA